MISNLKLWLGASALALVTACDQTPVQDASETAENSAEPSVAQELNVYSYRQTFLIEPMLEAFTEETGIKTNVVYVQKGLAERLAQEGELSPADIVLTVDISRLQELVDRGVTQPIVSEVVEQNVPEQYRDDQWVGLTTRARAVYSSKERLGALGAEFDYLDLADEAYRGRICTRPMKHPYNVSLVASMIAHYGLEETKAWLEGVKANLARKPQGNDRAQVKAIKEGLCDISLGNSYYLGKMLNTEEQIPWAESVVINFPGQEANGTHVNLSGVAMAKYAPHPEAALALIEFLTEDQAQYMYAELNYEYPVKAGVGLSELVQSWGEFNADAVPLTLIAEHKQDALKLIDEVQIDL